jgi:phage terminase large subunit
MDIEVSHVFENIHDVIFEGNLKIKYGLDNKLIIHQGSARSGKTHSILQSLILIHKNNKNLKIVLARATRKSCRDTIFEDFKTILRDLKFKYFINKSDLEITVGTCVYKFIGLDDPGSVHGASQDILYINEIMNVKIESFKQTFMRTNLFTIVDYNPSSDTHYIYDYSNIENSSFYKSALFKEVQGKYKGEEDVVMYDEHTDTSVLLMNPFAPVGQWRNILMNRPCKHNEEYGVVSNWHWQVYGLGNKCAKEGLIFERYNVIDYYDSIRGDLYYGLDFGFSSSFNAMIEVKRVDKCLYLKQLIYKRGMTNPVLIDEIKRLRINNAEIICDSARSDLIADLVDNNINAYSCKKTAGFKNNKIKQILGYTLFIDHESLDLIKEISEWMWKQNRNGESLDEPVKVGDHLMDAFIYSVEKMTDSIHEPVFKILSNKA